MKPFSSTTKKEEYARVRKGLRELETQQALLEAKKAKIEAEVCFEQFYSEKKQKMDIAPNSTSKPKPIQAKIHCFFRPKNPHELMESVLSEILDSALNTITIKQDSQECEELPRHLKVKCSYSKLLKTEVKAYLIDHHVTQTFIYYNRKIPRSTLYDWSKENQINKSSGKQGRSSPFQLLGEELFMWFLKSRGRKLIVSQSSLVIKALKISKELLQDESVILFPE